MTATEKKHLNTLRFNTYYTNEINIFNSDALIAIASRDYILNRKGIKK